MPELYLRLLDRILTPILLLLAAFLLIRGHNLPGGGFIAGLMAAAAFGLQILSRGDEFVTQEVGRFLQPATGLGLVIAALAAASGMLQGTFFKSLWPALDALNSLGTPVLFDIGVFLVVVTVTTSYLLGLSQASRFDMLEPQGPSASEHQTPGRGTDVKRTQ